MGVQLGLGGGYGTRMSVKSNDGGGGGYGTRMSVKSNDGGGGVMVQECQWKVMTGEGGVMVQECQWKVMTGEGGLNSARPAVMLQMSLLSCVFLVLYGGSGSYGRDRSVCDTIHAG